MEETKKNVLDEVKARMKEIKEAKAAQLETIYKKQAEAYKQIEDAEAAMKRAAEEMDVDSYEEAKTKKHKAKTALDMYDNRYNQIKQQDYMSEDESNEVIRSLLDCEKQLEEDFRQTLGEQKKTLEQLLKDYREDVEEVEQILSSWHAEIRRNYIDWDGITSYFDPVTKQTTNRSPDPIPIHRVTYRGCSEADMLREWLSKAW